MKITKNGSQMLFGIIDDILTKLQLQNSSEPDFQICPRWWHFHGMLELSIIKEKKLRKNE